MFCSCNKQNNNIYIIVIFLQGIIQTINQINQFIQKKNWYKNSVRLQLYKPSQLTTKYLSKVVVVYRRVIISSLIKIITKLVFCTVIIIGKAKKENITTEQTRNEQDLGWVLRLKNSLSEPMFAEKVIELLKDAERNPDTIDQFNVSYFIITCKYVDNNDKVN